jgi:hypothetical protein
MGAFSVKVTLVLDCAAPACICRFPGNVIP